MNIKKDLPEIPKDIYSAFEQKIMTVSIVDNQQCQQAFEPLVNWWNRRTHAREITQQATLVDMLYQEKDGVHRPICPYSPGKLEMIWDVKAAMAYYGNYVFVFLYTAYDEPADYYVVNGEGYTNYPPYMANKNYILPVQDFRKFFYYKHFLSDCRCSGRGML